MAAQGEGSDSDAVQQCQAYLPVAGSCTGCWGFLLLRPASRFVTTASAIVTVTPVRFSNMSSGLGPAFGLLGYQLIKAFVQVSSH